jgi:hypothetical protein
MQQAMLRVVHVAPGLDASVALALVPLNASQPRVALPSVSYGAASQFAAVAPGWYTATHPHRWWCNLVGGGADQNCPRDQQPRAFDSRTNRREKAMLS